ncbi:hypothetical protein FACS1894206_05290 [Deltaproteobacteria bacterium]|nr:hypothetical protein FACS1894206_05290 [Deltaproteobacteria bacterium]
MGVDALLDYVVLPQVMPVRQRYARPQLTDIEGEITRQLLEKGNLSSLRPGQTVAITAGSRGISNLPLAIRTVARAVKKIGAIPFIVPAMGSHGGATAEGQIKLLRGFGIDEDSVEAPIRATMDTVIVGHTDTELPAHLDAFAAEADAIIVMNKIKPHPAFRAPTESGLMKMITIGLGKQKGAENCHRLGPGQLAVNVPAIARVMLKKKNIIACIGILENAFHETARIEVLGPHEVEAREAEMLKEAWQLCPRLFFDELDVLIIDEIGKDISGAGYDTNIVGRHYSPYAAGGPAITKIATLDLTDKSRGNANGLGVLDFTTKRVYDKFDPEQTYPNSLTSTNAMPVKIPMVLKNDRQAIQAAVKTCNAPDKDAVRLVRIKNTLSMEQIYVSEALEAYCEKHPNLELLGPPQAFGFNDAGNLF